MKVSGWLYLAAPAGDALLFFVWGKLLTQKGVALSTHGRRLVCVSPQSHAPLFLCGVVCFCAAHLCMRVGQTCIPNRWYKLVRKGLDWIGLRICCFQLALPPPSPK